GRHRSFQLCLAQLLKSRGAEHGVVERSCAQPNHRILVRTLEAFLIGTRHPQCEQTQNATGLLKTWQRLPLALEHGNDSRMKWICCGKCLARPVRVKLAWQLL